MAACNIEKLNATTCANWCSDTKYLLSDKGVWDTIVGSKCVPEKSITVTPSLSPYPEPKIESFKVKAHQALF